MSEKTGAEVVAQARDDSVLNTDPLVVRGAVVSLVGAAATILVVAGVLDEDQKQVLQENAGTIAVAAMTILPILTAIWGRFAVFSPRSAAKIAVENATLPAGSAPTLISPP